MRRLSQRLLVDSSSQVINVGFNSRDHDDAVSAA
jgi:hypothetical protein